MGANYAAGLAGAVTDGLASLESGIAAHLAGNMFPALPLGYVQPIIDALLALAETKAHEQTQRDLLAIWVAYANWKSAAR